MKKFKIIKRCGTCKKEFNALPQLYKIWIDDESLLGDEPTILGFHFDCECGSSLFIKESLVVNEEVA